MHRTSAARFFGVFPALLACYCLALSRAAAADTAFPSVNDLPLQTNLPDPLRLTNGQRISTPEQWAQHRGQMREIIEHYAIGHAPPPPGNVAGRELKSLTVLDDHAVYRLIHLSFGPASRLGFDAALFVPVETAMTKAPFPTIVQPSFARTPGDVPAPVDGDAGRLALTPPSPEEAATNYAAILFRGYAVMTFYYQDCGADNTNFAQTGFFPAYPGYDWRDLAAWAWGMSRCVDYLEQQPFVDKSRIIAVGHSRLGKATLIAGAFDDRFALVAPAGSGCGGTGAYRFNGKGRGGKEGLEDATKRFPQWFLPRLAEFSGQVNRLPFDQNWLIDLVAPRAFIAADGLSDPYANGNALAQAWLAAQPVYELLGVPDRLGVHFRPGTHLLAPADWQAILDFSDQQLRGLKIPDHFHQLPPPRQLH